MPRAQKGTIPDHYSLETINKIPLVLADHATEQSNHGEEYCIPGRDIEFWLTDTPRKQEVEQ